LEKIFIIRFVDNVGSEPPYCRAKPNTN
jgi:hypothetical protein